MTDEDLEAELREHMPELIEVGNQIGLSLLRSLTEQIDEAAPWGVGWSAVMCQAVGRVYQGLALSLAAGGEDEEGLRATQETLNTFFDKGVEAGVARYRAQQAASGQEDDQ